MQKPGRIVFSQMDKVLFGKPAADAIVEEAQRLPADRAFLVVSGTRGAWLAIRRGVARGFPFLRDALLGMHSRTRAGRGEAGSLVSLVAAALAMLPPASGGGYGADGSP